MKGKRSPDSHPVDRVSRILRRLTTGVAVLACSGSLFAGLAYSQATGPSLVLRGEVVKTELYRVGQENYYRVKLKVEFENTGEKPIILLLGTYGKTKPWWILSASFSFSIEDALAGKLFFGGASRPANSSSMPSWRRLRRQLSTRVPPRSVTRLIRPKERFVSYTFAGVSISDMDKVASKSLVWLRVLMEMWPLNLDGPSRQHQESQNSATFGEKLKQSWQKSGELWLATILSEPIRFEMPE